MKKLARIYVQTMKEYSTMQHLTRQKRIKEKQQRIMQEHNQPKQEGIRQECMHQNIDKLDLNVCKEGNEEVVKNCARKMENFLREWARKEEDMREKLQKNKEKKHAMKVVIKQARKYAKSSQEPGKKLPGTWQNYTKLQGTMQEGMQLAGEQLKIMMQYSSKELGKKLRKNIEELCGKYARKVGQMQGNG